MVEAKKGGKKSALKTPRFKALVQKASGVPSGDIETVSNVIGKWKLKAQKSNQDLLAPVQQQNKNEPIMKNLHLLEIHKEELQKLRKNVYKPPRPKVLKDVLVRRVRENNKKCVTYAVLKPASEDSKVPLKNVTNYAGPRFDSERKFISHSILGSLTDFKIEAQKRGEFKELFLTTSSENTTTAMKRIEKPCSSLKLWKDRVRVWNSLHGFLEKRVERPSEDLLMRTPNDYPEIVNQRRIINLAMEATTSGYGQKRKAANFFKLSETICDGEFPVFSTLDKSVTEDYTPVEIRGTPHIIDKEKGSDASVIRHRYPAYHTPYLQEQELNLKEYIDKLVPYLSLVNLKDLQVVGEASSKSLSGENIAPVVSQETVSFQSTVADSPHISQISDEMIGPAILIENQTLRWTGHGLSKQGEPGIQASVLFDGYQNEILHQNLRIENVGSTRLLYKWKRAPARISYDIPRQKTQRFFFLSEEGVLRPGEVLLLPVLCKSSVGGIYYETWKIETDPILDQGSDIVIKFKAVIHNRETHINNFAKIEESLLHNKATTIVSEIVDKLVKSIRTPEPKHSYIEYVSPEEKFITENPGILYHSSTLRCLENYHAFLIENVPIIPVQYRDFSLQNLRRAIILVTDIEEGELEDSTPLIAEIDEDWDYTKRRLLWRYLRQVNSLCCSWPEPMANLDTVKHIGCCSIFASAFDRFSDRSAQLATFLNLPIRTDEEEPTEKLVSKKNNNKGGKRKSSQVVSRIKRGKETMSPRGKTPVPTPSTVRGNQKSCTPVPVPDESTDDVMESFCPVAKGCVEIEKYDGYKDKLYQLMYAELSSALDKMMILCEEK
ncbi:MYCBP-associated protein-like [Saccostrea cucullata]|uniref:MYCBP-associated protein-like n=1 Tax=Saccostrea cuccullata TaxID=36930 RepID=UPI002ED3610B